MLKIITGFLFCSLISSHHPFTLPENANRLNTKVTVRIDRLKAISRDACNEIMDFKAIITIGSAIKKFPVMEGNDIRPGWEFTVNSIQKQINIKIEIWDDDDALCGGGDDIVIVEPNGATKILVSIDPAHPGTKTSTLRGKKISGKEQGEIKFTITTESL